VGLLIGTRFLSAGKSGERVRTEEDTHIPLVVEVEITVLRYVQSRPRPETEMVSHGRV